MVILDLVHLIVYFSSGGAGGHCGTLHYYDQLLDFPSVAFVDSAVSVESEF